MQIIKYRILIRHLSFGWCAWCLLCFTFLSAVFAIFALSDQPDLLNRFLAEDGLDHFASWFLPQIPWFLPISSFFGTLFCLLFLRQRREWLAMQASGVPAYLVLFVYLTLGLIPTCLVWVASNAEEVSGVNGSEFSRHQGFQMKVERTRAWYFESFDANGSTGKNLQLYSYDRKGNDSFRIRAEQAVFNGQSGWTFKIGRFLGFPSHKGLPVPNQGNDCLQWRTLDEIQADFLQDEFTGPLMNKSFDTLTIEELRDDPLPHLMLKNGPKALSLKELDYVLEEFAEVNSEILAPYELRRAQMLLNSPSCMVAIFFAFCIGVGRGKVSIGQMIGVTLLGLITFYVLRTTFDALGEEAVIKPTLAAVLPYAISVLGGWVLYLKKR